PRRVAPDPPTAARRAAGGAGPAGRGAERTSPPPDPETAAALRALLAEGRAHCALAEAWPVAQEFATELGYEARLIQPRRRRELGVPQEQAGALLGRTSRTWTGWEQGTAPIPAQLVAPVAAVLGLDGDQRRRLWRLRFHREPDPVIADPDPALIHP